MFACFGISISQNLVKIIYTDHSAGGPIESAVLHSTADPNVRLGTYHDQGTHTDMALTTTRIQKVNLTLYSAPQVRRELQTGA